ncbi:hypothetical protein BGZ88_001502, partial [Linnemannia elongata]
MQFKTSLIASFTVMLALAASTAQAFCQTACASIQAPEGVCSYQCTPACGQAAEVHRQQFLKDLKLQKSSCKSIGTANSDALRITCAATALHGSCGAHKWKCG